MDNGIKQKNNKVCGMGIASFVLAILSIVTMCYVVFSVAFGIFAIILGILSIFVEGKNSMGIAGLVISVISVLMTIILFVTLGVMDIDLLCIPDYYKFM